MANDYCSSTEKLIRFEVAARAVTVASMAFVLSIRPVQLVTLAASPWAIPDSLPELQVTLDLTTLLPPNEHLISVAFMLPVKALSRRAFAFTSSF